MNAKMGWEIIQPRSRLNSSSSSSRGLFRRLPGVGQPLLGPRLAQPARLDGEDGLGDLRVHEAELASRAKHEPVGDDPRPGLEGHGAAGREPGRPRLFGGDSSSSSSTSSSISSSISSSSSVPDGLAAFFERDRDPHRGAVDGGQARRGVEPPEVARVLLVRGEVRRGRLADVVERRRAEQDAARLQVGCDLPDERRRVRDVLEHVEAHDKVKGPRRDRPLLSQESDGGVGRLGQLFRKVDRALRELVVVRVVSGSREVAGVDAHAVAVGEDLGLFRGRGRGRGRGRRRRSRRSGRVVGDKVQDPVTHPPLGRKVVPRVGLVHERGGFLVLGG